MDNKNDSDLKRVRMIEKERMIMKYMYILYRVLMNILSYIKTKFEWFV